jgi:hypothetical protein
MQNERPQTPAKETAPPKQQPQPSGRSGEGARSVLPHLKADQRARAAARIAKRSARDF